MLEARIFRKNDPTLRASLSKPNFIRRVRGKALIVGNHKETGRSQSAGDNPLS